MDKTVAKLSSRTLSLIIASGLAQMIVVVDYMAAAVALPKIAEDFGVSADSLQWVITGYVLSFSAVLGIAGPLGDRFGRKKLLLLGIVIFGLVSIWVGCANSVTNLIVSRIALGVGGGLLFPLSTAVVSASVGKQELPRTLSILTGIGTIGMAIGPVVGGVFTEELSWRWVFFINIPIAVIACVAVMIFATESKDTETKGRIDIPGIILLLVGLALLAVGVAGIPDWPLAQWLTITTLGICSLVAFAFIEFRTAFPVIDLRMLSNRGFAGYLWGGTLSNSCWCIIIFATTMHFQKVANDDAMTTGFLFLFMSASVATASFTGPFMQRCFGTRTLLLIALAIQFAASLLFWLDHTQPWISIALLIVGFGCSWGWSMSQAGGIVTVPENKVGLASGSMLTSLIMVGNMAVVISATFMASLGGTGEINYAPGVSATYALSMAMSLAGFIGTALIVPREQSSA